MNSIPQPADLSKLKGILGKAKAVMNTVNEGNYQTGNIDASSLVQNTDNYSQTPIQGQMHSQPSAYAPSSAPQRPITEEAISKSGMPDSIKKIMLENPIQQPSMNHSFSLDDVSELMEEKPMPAPTANRASRSQVNESVISQQNDKFTVSESTLRSIVKDVLIEYLTTDYQKQLTEGVIKKTINTLIKEGKIKTKR